MAEDLASRVEPTPEELQRHFEAQLDRYLLPARVSFSHIYFSVDRRGDEAESDARAALAHPETARGDPFMLQSDFPSRTQQEVRELFGVDFARALFELEPADWRGPITSSYGLHLVRVHQRSEGRKPELSEVRDRVRNDLLDQRRREADKALVDSLKERYEIVVEGRSEP